MKPKGSQKQKGRRRPSKPRKTRPVMQHGIKKGDIFYTSWGYDQTNYDYVVVEEVSKTGKTVICRMAKLKSSKATGWGTMAQKPSREGFGDRFRLQVRKYNDEVLLRGSYPYIRGDRSIGMRPGGFMRHKEGKTYFETAPGYGH